MEGDLLCKWTAEASNLKVLVSLCDVYIPRMSLQKKWLQKCLLPNKKVFNLTGKFSNKLFLRVFIIAHPTFAQIFSYLILRSFVAVRNIAQYLVRAKFSTNKVLYQKGPITIGRFDKICSESKFQMGKCSSKLGIGIEIRSKSSTYDW